MDDARQLTKHQHGIVFCGRIAIVKRGPPTMRTIAKYTYCVWSELKRYNSMPSDLPILLVFSLLGSLTSWFAAMHNPQFSPAAEFQSDISADMSTTI